MSIKFTWTGVGCIITYGSIIYKLHNTICLSNPHTSQQMVVCNWIQQHKMSPWEMRLWKSHLHFLGLTNTHTCCFKSSYASYIIVMTRIIFESTLKYFHSCLTDYLKAFINQQVRVLILNLLWYLDYNYYLI